jgi:hypothetical protein
VGGGLMGHDRMLLGRPCGRPLALHRGRTRG